VGELRVIVLSVKSIIGMQVYIESIMRGEISNNDVWMENYGNELKILDSANLKYLVLSRYVNIVKKYIIK
jgi:hypothetical protein